MAEIISSKSPEAVTTDPDAKMQNKYFTKFIVNLLRVFSTDRHLLEDRGTFIIRELCILLSAEDIYKTLANILLEEQNLSFACTMIQTLNVILLTSSELFDLRNKLRHLDSPVSTLCTSYSISLQNFIHIIEHKILIFVSLLR